MAKTTTDKKADEQPAEDPKAGTEVAVAGTDSTDLVGAEEDDFFAGAGEGLEDFQQSDLLIPYVRIIQALSKELQKNHAKHLQGAEQGFFVNSATRKLYNGEVGFHVVPVSFGHRYMAWKPNNGGPAYDMGNDASKYKGAIPDEKGKRRDEEGNELTDSLQYFVILVDKVTGEYEIAVLNFGGSQARKGRGWASTINNRMERHPTTQQLVRPAIYFYSYLITTVPESNDQGSWYGFSVAEGPKVMDLPNGKEIFRTAKELREKIEGGEVKAAVEAPQEEAEEERAF
jgi:hypothetical protein